MQTPAPPINSLQEEIIRLIARKWDLIETAGRSEVSERMHAEIRMLEDQVHELGGDIFADDFPHSALSMEEFRSKAGIFGH